LIDIRTWPPSRWFGVIALSSLAMLAAGLVLQHGFGLEPCPMCIVQRYAMFLIALCAISAWASSRKVFKIVFSSGVVLFALAGAAVAARQSWLQWYPPEIVSCGRDFYGMVENLPIKRALPMIFAGNGDCTKVDWSFLGLSIANWAFLYFVAVAALATGVSLPRRSASR
jgi:disulfide bond formation protein DsbB